MKTILICICALTVFGCESKPSVPTEVELKEIVQQQNEKLKQLYMAGDVDKLAEIYALNAKLSGDGNNEIVRGRDAIKNFWKKEMAGAKLLDMTSETLSIDASGDVIYETGKVSNKIEIQDSVYTFKAKYVNVWKKEDGVYKLDIDTWIGISE